MVLIQFAEINKENQVSVLFWKLISLKTFQIFKLLTLASAVEII